MTSSTPVAPTPAPTFGFNWGKMPLDLRTDCYSGKKIISNGFWVGDNPFSYSLPMFLCQLILIVTTSRALAFLLKPLRQPRVVAEFLSGIVLHQIRVDVLLTKMIKWVDDKNPYSLNFFPTRGISILMSAANIGLIFFSFMLGVEMDLTLLRQNARKVAAISAASIVVPFALVYLVASRFGQVLAGISPDKAFHLYLALGLSATAFQVVARVATDLKLANTDIARIAVASSVINSLLSYVILEVVLTLLKTSLPGDEEHTIPALYMLLCCAALAAVCVAAVRPAIRWLERQTPEGEPMSNMHQGIVLFGAMIAAFASDAIGLHCAFGAFLYGLAMPHTTHAAALVERLDVFMTSVLLPCHFFSSGLRANLESIEFGPTTFALVAVFLVAAVAKVAATVLASVYMDIPRHEALSLGLLMNTRGFIDVMTIDMARQAELTVYRIYQQVFPVLLVLSIATTAAMSPLLLSAYRPSRRLVGYKRRNLQRGAKPGSQLRMLACVHTGRNVPSILSLLDISNPTKRSPIFVHAVHLIELAGRASSMLIVHSTASRGLNGGGNHHRRRSTSHHQAQSEHIISAFESYEQHAGGVSVQALTNISPYSSMHDDICTIAEDRQAALIVLPFHKQQTVDGGMDSGNPAIRNINLNVLSKAPCSVAILVDRGLSTALRMHHTERHIALLFFGGPDDREALAYAWRMADHPAVTITLVRFIPGEAAMAQMPKPPQQPASNNVQHSRAMSTIVTDGDRQRQLDDEYVSEFRLRHLSDESIFYVEKVVNSSEETVAAIKSLGGEHDLYIVGRSHGVVSPITAGLTEWMECPELGPIGDLLASADFGAAVSVLVLQQYVEQEEAEGGGGNGGEELVMREWRSEFRGAMASDHEQKETQRVRTRAGRPGAVEASHNSVDVM